MLLQPFIKHRLLELYPDLFNENFEQKEIRKFIITHHINLYSIITERTPVTFPILKDDEGNVEKNQLFDTPSGKLARVLNVILMDHFESTAEFRDVLSIDEIFLTDIWRSDIRNPSIKLIRKLISEWDVNPLFLYGTRKDCFVGTRAAQ